MSSLKVVGGTVSAALNRSMGEMLVVSTFPARPELKNGWYDGEHVE